MKRLNVLLLNSPLRNKRNVGLAHGSADRLGVIAIVLLPSYKWLHKLPADYFHSMDNCLEFPYPAESARAGLDCNRTALQLSDYLEKLVSHDPPLDDEATATVYAMKLEHVLGDIDAENV